MNILKTKFMIKEDTDIHSITIEGHEIDKANSYE